MTDSSKLVKVKHLRLFLTREELELFSNAVARSKLEAVERQIAAGGNNKIADHYAALAGRYSALLNKAEKAKWVRNRSGDDEK